MTYETELPRHQREMLQQMLHKGETLHWTGKPLPRMFTAATMPTFLFGVPWTAFIAFFTYMAWLGDGGNVMLFFTIPFWVVGIGMLSTPLFHRMFVKHTFYALTDGRALVIRKRLFGGMSIKSYELDVNLVSEFQLRSNGTGDIIFRNPDMTVTYSHHGNTRTLPEGFLSLPNVHAVHELIHSLTEAKGKTSEE